MRASFNESNVTPSAPMTLVAAPFTLLPSDTLHPQLLSYNRFPEPTSFGLGSLHELAAALPAAAQGSAHAPLPSPHNSSPGASSPSTGDHSIRSSELHSAGDHTPNAYGGSSGEQATRPQREPLLNRNRTGSGYRRMWGQIVSGQRLAQPPTPTSDLTVEDLSRAVMTLPPGESVVGAVAGALRFLDSSALAALMKELGRQGQTRRAQEIFDWVRSLPLEHELAGLLDTYSYTTSISICAGGQQLRRALELVADMRARRVPANVHTYTSLINVCIKSSELELAQDVYRQMLEEGCAPNLVTYNTLIDLYVKTGQWREAVKMLDTLEKQSIQPEVRTYNTIISACSKSCEAEEAMRIYERMVSSGVKPSATTYTALITAYGKRGQVDKAMDVFQDMIRRGCERNVITYSSLISACERAQRCDMALELFDKMHTEGCTPNVVTYNSLIAACAHGAQWQKAAELFDRMIGEGCAPDSITYSALIASYERGGQWHRALKALEQMQAEGCHPDAVIYNTLLQALWSSGVVGAQMRAAQLWSQASRSGHFRIYQQHKHDSSVLSNSCVVCTCGAAIVTVIRWLSELRHKLHKEGRPTLCDRAVLSLQKGKPNRAEQPSLHLFEAVKALLEGHAAPFRVQLIEQATTLEADAGELAAWLRSPDFAPLLAIVAGCKAQSVDMLAAEDAATEARCLKAYGAVRRYEDLQLYLAGGHVVTSPAQRSQLVQLALQYGSAFGFRADTIFDALQLFWRVVGATPLPVTPGAWPLLLCASVLIAGRQGEHPGMLPMYDTVVLHTGLTLDAILGMEKSVYATLQHDTSAISALRVAHLYLERLGHYQQDTKQATTLGRELQLLAHRAAASAPLSDIPPSVLAACAVFALRKRAGLVPFWPGALVALTGYQHVEVELAPCLQTVSALLR